MLTFFVAAGFFVGTISLVFAGYFGMRALMGHEHGSDTRELAGSVLFRISALHGLILALVFAQQMTDYRVLQDELIKEASAVADIYNDLDRFGTDQTALLRDLLVNYAKDVVEGEWIISKDKDDLNLDGWEKWGAVYEGVLDLDAVTARQVSLRGHMLGDIHLIANMRDLRTGHGLRSLIPMFWFAAIGGVVLVAFTYFTFPPSKRHLTLLSVFGAFTGLILFFIYAFSNPFEDPGALEPVAMEQFLFAIGEL